MIKFVLINDKDKNVYVLLSCYAIISIALYGFYSENIIRVFLSIKVYLHKFLLVIFDTL